MSALQVYLDHAAATPMDERVLQAMQPYFTELYYNPSASYQAGKRVRVALDSARSLAAQWLGVRANEIIFTAGATEANNLAIHGIMQRFPDANAVVSAIEHESVLVPARQYAVREAAVTADGIIDLQNLGALIDDDTVLVSVMYANNEIGTVQPLREIAALIQTIRRSRQAAGNSTPLYFHSDAAQAANYLDLHCDRLGVDLLSINGSKIYGPKQSGLLYVKAGLELTPLILGGGQERSLRSGTENVAGSIGLATALAIVQQSRHDETRRLTELQRQFIRGVLEIPGVRITGSQKRRLPSNIHITIDGQDNERLLISLDEAGIMAAAGSACSASSDVPSHVLLALGLSEDEARSSLRFSMGRATDRVQIERTVSVLRELVSA